MTNGLSLQLPFDHAEFTFIHHHPGRRLLPQGRSRLRTPHEMIFEVVGTLRTDDPGVQGGRGRPRRRPDVLPADRGHDHGHDRYRRPVWALGVKPLMARRSTEHGSGPSAPRRVVERAFTPLHRFRRLRIR
ncbi:hypothetical protein [Streptomyces sp. NPDC015125]|uniref:hypothetical protein n=1 Tax=Streptomyces sp. NPDC015125 TaxID=3364938 RepID=UPI003700D024